MPIRIQSMDDVGDDFSQGGTAGFGSCFVLSGCNDRKRWMCSTGTKISRVRGIPVRVGTVGMSREPCTCASKIRHAMQKDRRIIQNVNSLSGSTISTDGLAGSVPWQRCSTGGYAAPGRQEAEIRSNLKYPPVSRVTPNQKCEPSKIGTFRETTVEVRILTAHGCMRESDEAVLRNRNVRYALLDPRSAVGAVGVS